VISFGLGVYGGGTFGGGGAPAPAVVASTLSARGYAATVMFDPVTNDVHFSSLKIAKGDDAIAQKLRQRLRFFKGEWFLDTRLGVPYLREAGGIVFGVKGPNVPAINAVFRQVILSVPQITKIQSLTFTVDTKARKGTLDFVALLDDGRTLTADAEPFIV
jgi:hypothetical protein